MLSGPKEKIKNTTSIFFRSFNYKIRIWNLYAPTCWFLWNHTFALSDAIMTRISKPKSMGRKLIEWRHIENSKIREIFSVGVPSDNANRHLHIYSNAFICAGIRTKGERGGQTDWKCPVINSQCRCRCH